MTQTLTLWAKAKIKCFFILFFSCLLTLSAQYAPTDDFDGDGIINSIDIDDDNDGVLDVVENTGNGSCDTSGGVDISTLNFMPSAGNNTVVNTTSSTINVTGNSWHSDYSTTTVSSPFYFEFTADASTGNMMIGVIGSTQAQPTGTNSYSANSYKFQFQDGFNYQIYRYAVTAVTGKLYGAGDKFSIEVNASNNIVMKRNGVVVYTDAIVTGDTQFKLHISVTSGRTFSNVVWGTTSSITTTCEDADSDTDGILNRFELDSDNDGCSDAYEAGASSNPAFTQFPAGNVGTNGFENSLETTTDSGVYNGVYTYQHAMNGNNSACVDSDGDGIRDIDDKDDDNDGVPDSLETISDCGDGTGRTLAWDWEDEKTQSSSYAYFANKPEYRPLAGPGIDLLGAGGAWRVMNIDNDGTLANAITLGEYIYGQFTVREKGIYVNGWEYYQINNTGSATQPKMGILIDEDPNFGSPTVVNDGVAAIQTYGSITYVDGFPRALAHVSNPTYLYPNTTYYVRFYDLKTNGFNDVSHDEIGLVFEEVPGGVDCGGDIYTDGDAVPNRLDLDSDGDGCSDLVESGVSPVTDVITPSGTNNVGGSYGIVDPTGAQLNPAATDVNNDGINDSIDSDLNGYPNYSSSYQLYAISADVNACADTDGDGIADLFDIDDDNDGIVDAVESPSCFYTSAEAGTIAVVSTPLSNDDGVDVNLPFMHDGVNTTVTASNNVITINQSVNGAVIYSIEYPTPVKLTSISHYGTTFGTSATAKIQGSNDKIIWDELMTAATAATANPKVFTVNNNAANYYRYYRIVKVAGTTTPAITTYEVSAVQNTTGYNPSTHPKPACSEDTDADGIFNHHDLDSDGDGCSDLVEAGVSPSTDVTDAGTENAEGGGSWGIEDPAGAQLNPAATDANNDGLNDSVDTGQDGQADYASTYTQYAVYENLDVCADTDGDGIPDLIDIDDDNDGSVDAVESPDCYYTQAEAGVMSKVSTGLSGTTVNSIQVTTGANIPTMHDGVSTTVTASNHIVPAGVTNTTAAIIYNIEYPAPVNLASVSVIGATASWGTGSFAVLEASNDGLSFTAVSAPLATSAGTTKTWTVIAPGTTTAYKYYRIRVSTVGSTTPTFTNYEVISVLGSLAYTPSAHPKPDCVSDFDGDGINNHQDLDSDDDGCSDLVEAGVSPSTDVTDAGAENNEGGSWGIEDPAGAQLNPAATDANNDGLNDSVDADLNHIPDYHSNYNPYALGENINFCIDTDGDGIPDFTDIDDDNDGVVDAMESPACFYTSAEAIIPVKISTGIVSSTVNSVAVTPGNDIPTMHDGVITTVAASNHVVPVTQLGTTSTVIYKVEYPTAVGLTQMVVYTATASWGTGAFAVLEGSMDDMTYEAVSVPVATSTGTTKTWPVTLNTAKLYKYYRIRVSTVGSTQPTFTNYEVVGTIKTTTFIPSAHPKPTCDNDLDGDGINNHQDLDSDGDGCPDLVEAGVSPDDDVMDAGAENNEGESWGIDDPAGAQLNPAGTDANNDGLNDSVDTGQDGQTDYTSTYNRYALNDELNLCTDTDGDGIIDIIDIDDDNDGIIDTNEQIAETCDSEFPVSNRVIWESPLGTTSTVGNLTIDGESVQVTATTTKTFNALRSEHWAFGSGTYTGCPDVTPLVTNSAINIFTNDYTVTYTFSKPVKNPGLSFSSFNGTAVNFTQPVYVSGLQGTVSGVNVGSYITTIPATENIVAVTYNGVYNSISFTAPGSDNQGAVMLYIEDVLAPGSGTFTVTSGGILEYEDIDTDGDGIPNRLDLDSDNDGCPDLAEADVSPDTDVTDAAATNNEGGEWGADNLTGAQLDINGTDANNDGLNDSVDVNLNGQTDYTSTYTIYALANNWSTCADTDNDSVNDMTDIDDDNDGILDAEESPNCFYTQAEAGVISTITSQFVSPDDDQSDGDIQLLHDGAATLTFNFNAYTAVQNPTGSNLFTVQYPTPVRLATLVVSQRISATTNANAVVVGSNDGITWSAALTPSTLITSSPVTFTITAPQDYKYYKIQTGSVAGVLAVANTIGEITSTIAAGYIPSAHPKPNCATDTDNDGVMNHHDLDSDGDGCPDMKETGVYQYAIDNGVDPQPGDGSVTNGNGTDDTENTTETTSGAQFSFVSPVNDTNENGFVDDLETDTEGEYDGTYDMSIYLDPDEGNCVCYKPGAVGTALTSINGITTLNSNNKNPGEWENMPQNAFLVLESKEKGFVITRMANPEATITGTNAVEGMLVYDTDDNCLKMYDGTSWFCLQQRCPE